jgi:hypothetical protein
VTKAAISRIRLLVLLAACIAIGAAQASVTTGSNAALVARIDASLAGAGRFIIEKQATDGAWRSETYGCFRDGPSLTPLVMSALFFIPQAGDEAKASFRKGVDYLVGMVGPDGAINAGPGGLNFPVLTSSSASRVVVLQERTKEHLRAQAAWLKYLRERQLNERLGWKPSDPDYGGWGFSIEIPRKPAPGQPKEMFFESNMVATIFAVAALRSAKIPADDPLYRQVLAFVKRCQNFSDDPVKADPRFDDGGFFFIPGDPLQNKAGIAGKDRLGRQRFHSYGTMTADGLRALIRCGLPLDSPRVVAARRWLERNFSAKTNPGTFARDREVLRNATYYYWCWAVAHAFSGLNLREAETRTGKVNWAGALAEELLKRQRPDGSWINRFTDAKEDDPLVATPWAAAALAICRQVITGEEKRLAPRPSAP